MSSETIEHFRNRRANIDMLRQIRHQIDPASGLSVSIRRGGARDNPDVEDDDERRPWVVTEFSDMITMAKVVDLAIAENHSSASYWLARARDEHRELSEFLAQTSSEAKP